MEEGEGAGGSGDAQLEPGPENRFWQVFGSHHAGPVSHCGRGGIRCGHRCPRTTHNGFRSLTHPAPLPVKNCWLARFKECLHWMEEGVSIQHVPGAQV